MYKHKNKIINLNSKGAFEVQHKNKQQKGFTIIETMIVLAIAGLIMLIVFLAVPALQRSARNTQRKNDAGNILSAINTWVSNNEGQLPTSQTQINSAICGIHLGFYTQPNCSSNKTIAQTPTNGLIYSSTVPGVCTSTSCNTSGDVSASNIYFLSGYTCQGNTPAQGSSRAFAVFYEIETSSTGVETQCTAS